ncbi:unnamed protein product, partial [Polarella glacialis]
SDRCRSGAMLRRHARAAVAAAATVVSFQALAALPAFTGAANSLPWASLSIARHGGREVSQQHSRRSQEVLCAPSLAGRSPDDRRTQQLEHPGEPEADDRGLGRRRWFLAGAACLGGALGPLPPVGGTTARAVAAVPTAKAAEPLAPWAAAASGALQGIAQNLAKQLVLHPFDTVKTRLQASPDGGAKDLVDRKDLFQGLYRGFLPCLVSGTPGSAAFFAAKEAAASALLSSGAPAQLSTLGGVVCGVLLSKAVKTPFDVAETRAMASTPSGPGADTFGWDGSWLAVRETFDREGVAGLYRGYGANVLYKLPADAAKFLAYEALRGSGTLGALTPAVAGAAATLAANAVTTPLDVVRTRVMLDASQQERREEGSEEGASKSSSNTLDTLKELLSSGDSAQIWSGLGWRIGRGIVAGAIQFTVLEGTKEVVEGRR